MKKSKCYEDNCFMHSKTMHCKALAISSVLNTVSGGTCTNRDFEQSSLNEV